jgi:YVTN family beta-propeller protein
MYKRLFLFISLVFLSSLSFSKVSYASTYAYISNNGDGTVSVIKTPDNTVSDTIAVGSEPLGVAVSPDGEFVYVANNGDGTVSVISSVFLSVVANIHVGGGPYGISVSPYNGDVYTTNQSNDTVSVINISEVTDTIAVGSEPLGVAVSPDGKFVYVANNGDGTVSVIKTSGNEVTDTIAVGSEPLGVAVSPDGKFVYVANNGGGTVSVIKTSGNEVTDTIAVGSEPLGVAVSPDGKFVYVANNGGGTVSVIKTSGNEVTDTIAVGSEPKSLGLFIGGKTPFAPSNLELAVLSDSKISLVWTDNSADECGFKIERKKGSTGIFSLIHTTEKDVESYNDSGLDSYRTYYYRVIAYNEAGDSACSSEAYATTEREHGGSCFIATAAFGSPLEPHVRVLRKFRDRFLVDNLIGRSFLRLYYKYSPPIATFIAKHEILRLVVRWGLIPIFGLGWLLLNAPALSSLLLLVLLLMSFYTVLSVKKKWVSKKHSGKA